MRIGGELTTRVCIHCIGVGISRIAFVRVLAMHQAWVLVRLGTLIRENGVLQASCTITSRMCSSIDEPIARAHLHVEKDRLEDDGEKRR